MDIEEWNLQVEAWIFLSRKGYYLFSTRRRMLSMAESPYLPHYMVCRKDWLRSRAMRMVPFLHASVEVIFQNSAATLCIFVLERTASSDHQSCHARRQISSSRKLRGFEGSCGLIIRLENGKYL